MKDEPVIVFSRNGQTTLIRGQRARLLILTFCSSTALMLVLLTLLLLGIAITFVTLLVLGIPLAIGLVISMEWIRSIRQRG